MAGPPTPIMIDRAELRSVLRQRRNTFVSQTEHVLCASAELRNIMEQATCLGSYVAMNSEASPERLHQSARSVALPRLAARGSKMTFHKWCEVDPLERAPFGFQQPLAHAEPVMPDVILTPLLGFDRNGNRIGQGAGHYDRYFESDTNALRIGIAFSIQEVMTIAVAAWDMPLDAIQTEGEWIVPGGSRLTS